MITTNLPKQAPPFNVEETVWVVIDAWRSISVEQYITPTVGVFETRELADAWIKQQSGNTVRFHVISAPKWRQKYEGLG